MSAGTESRFPEERAEAGAPGRLRLVKVPGPAGDAAFADAVRAGLGARPRSLPCRFFYDERGSRLFEEICRLPEYYPTRTEEGILLGAAPEIASSLGGEATLVELGSGSSRKTRLLIEALLARQGRLHYAPLDISEAFLVESARGLLARYPGLKVTAVAGEYRDALRHIPRAEGPRLVLFLGSNVGNLEEAEAVDLLSRLAVSLSAEDRLLVGFDRVKDPAVLERAYDDAAGVTEAFNKNLLLRVNRELGGRFDLDAWAHEAPWVAGRSRVEMRLVSREAQRVPVGALASVFEFERGEAIHTESCHKYTVPGFLGICAAAGLAPVRLWSDPAEWFGLALLSPARPGAAS